ncbi:MAG: 1-deoxy-D-xylulose-5-phosphate reductoisomerase [Chlamydiia bacterium]|nr:1-deoxy-D-xylulose-5-phosphate reductoisomerase [Chlamydiia bacterium]
MKKISILGSTGSIGKSALEIVEHLGPEYQIVALAAKSNVDLVESQAKKFRPELVALFDEKAARELKKRLPNLRVVSGMEGIIEAACHTQADTVLSAIAGTLGLQPTFSAIQAKKTICLANKETLVSGGDIVMRAAKANGVKILPVDSEHSALFQCLVGEKNEEVHRLILTASGGAFRDEKGDLSQKTFEEALKHPTWSMGPKVTIDSSTLMNKGLEMIEAHYLFDIPPERIDVVVHPQSVIHSLVEFKDGSMKAQLSVPDMKLPIQYAFTYPERRGGVLKPFDFIRHSRLEFLQADRKRFRCLDLAFEAMKVGQDMPGYMNAANEVLVERFLNGEFTWGKIAEKLSDLMEKHIPQRVLTLDDVLAVEKLAKEEALTI